MPAEIIEPPIPSSRSLPMGLVVAVGLLLLFTPAVAFAAGVRARPIENRPLAELPTGSDGWSVFPKLTAWATDRLPLRDRAIRLNDRLVERVFGQPPMSGTGGGPPVGGPGAAGSLDNLFPRVIEGEDGWLYVGSDTEVPCRATSGVGDIVAGVTALRDVVEASGRRFVLVIAPDKSTMVPQHLPDDYAGARCARDRKDAMWRALTSLDDHERWLVDLRAPLLDRQAADGLDIYLKHDTHWTPRGGAVYAQALLGLLQPGLTDLDDLVATGETDQVGDLAALLGRTSKDRVLGWALRRPGVVPPPDLPVPGPEPVPVRTTTTGAPLFEPSTLLLGDSFTAVSRSLLYPLFADLTVLHVQTGPGNPGAAAAAFAAADVVVIEIVERNLVSDGVPPFDPAFRQAVVAALG